MTILVDIDSTITNFAEVLLNVNNKRYNTTYKYTDIVSYNWFDCMFENPWHPTSLPKFWDEVQINSKAVSIIESWVEQGHKVFLVTASHFNNALGYKIHKTLEPFNPNLINERNIIVSQNKSIIIGDVMIDDYTGNLLNFTGLCVCYEQPWNKRYGGHFRYSDWDKIDSVIQVYNAYPWNK